MSQKEAEAVYQDLDRLIGAYSAKKEPPTSIKLSTKQWDILKMEHDRIFKSSGGRMQGPVSYEAGGPVYKGFRLERYAE